MRYSSIYCALLLGIYANATFATPFAAMDPRSMAMGGTGAASANAGQASFYNPALLATTQHTKRFSLEIPLAIRAADPDDLLGAADAFSQNNLVPNFENSSAEFTAAVKAVQDKLTANQAPTTAELQAVTTAQQNMIAASVNLKNGVKSLTSKVVTVDGNVSTVLGIPSKKMGFALVGSAWASGGVVGEFTPADETTIDGVIDVMDNVVVDPATNTYNIDNLYNPPSFTADNLSSNFQVRAAAVGEVGVNLAQERTIFGHTVAIGVTPKVMQISTFDYKLSGQNLNDPNVTSLDAGRKDYIGFNVDLGIAKEYGENWKTGVVVKNLIPTSYKTVLNNDIEINPALRVGGSYHNKRVTAALDLDITENEPAGFGEKSRYLALGGEVDLWLLKLRAGYQYNIANASSSLATVGFGINLVGLHVDVGGGFGEGGITTSAQLGFTW